MVYSVTITTTKAGSEAEASTTILKVTSGLLWLLEVEFPPGCCGLAHFQMFDGSYQVFPATPGESFHGDAVTLHFDDLYLKQSAPFEFKIKTWNTDDTWDHTLQVRVGMALSRAEMSRYMPALAFENFEALMRETAERQERIRQEQLEIMLKELSSE